MLYMHISYEWVAHYSIRLPLLYTHIFARILSCFPSTGQRSEQSKDSNSKGMQKHYE